MLSSADIHKMWCVFSDGRRQTIAAYSIWKSAMLPTSGPLAGAFMVTPCVLSGTHPYPPPFIAPNILTSDPWLPGVVSTLLLNVSQLHAVHFSENAQHHAEESIFCLISMPQYSSDNPVHNNKLCYDQSRATG